MHLCNPLQLAWGLQKGSAHYMGKQMICTNGSDWLACGKLQQADKAQVGVQMMVLNIHSQHLHGFQAANHGP